MLTLVSSIEPALPLQTELWPTEASALLHRLLTAPERCHWIVPSEARRRQLLRDWPTLRGQPAGFLPKIHSLDGFFALAGYHLGDDRPMISEAERLARMAQAWCVVNGNTPGPGFVGDLDRFVRDWQAVGASASEHSPDRYESVVFRYRSDLASDGRVDEPQRLQDLVAASSNPKSNLTKSLARSVDLLLIDGFHRLEPLELRLFAELANNLEVVWWSSADGISIPVSAVRHIRHAPPPPTPLAELGQRLYPPVQAAPIIVPGLFRMEADSRRAEVERVAQQIKADCREITSLTLPEIAVVLPASGYDALVQEIFPRHGLTLDMSKRVARLATSRPARLLLAAWDLLRSSWRYEPLADFLKHPAVRRRLDGADLLDDLFDHRPRARRQRTHQTWLDAWQRRVDGVAKIAAGRESGALAPPPGRDPNIILTETRERALGLARLLGSIRTVLQPVIDMEAILVQQSARMSALPELADACLNLLSALDLTNWLQPVESADNTADPTLAAELRKDVCSYQRLLDVLNDVHALPPQLTAFTTLWQAEPLEVLRGLLHTATCSDPTVAGHSVAVLELRDVPGLRFRQIYLLGMQEGAEPPTLSAPRRRYPLLRTQLQEGEDQCAARFAQVFRAAEDRVVLCRTLRDAGETPRPGTFWEAVAARAELPELPLTTQVSSVRSAGRRLGRAGARGRAAHHTLAELWPQPAAAALVHEHAALARWQQRPDWPHRNRIEAPTILRLLYPDQRALSASDLETYAACPFRYFGLNVLRLQERDPDQSRIHYGSMMHKILEAFYVELRAEFLGAEDEPLPPVDSAHRARLIELFEQHWRKLGDGMVPPDLRTLFASDQGVLQLFLDTMHLLEEEHGNLLNEYGVTDVPLGQDAAGRPVLLSGRIDRIDVHRDRRQAVVIDYKTGKATKPKERLTKMADGRMLQLPLYASALSQERQELEVVGGAYVHLSEREPQASKAIESAGVYPWNGSKSDLPFDIDAARAKAIELAGRIRAGDFSLTEHPVGTPYPECTSFCPLRHACRIG